MNEKTRSMLKKIGDHLSIIDLDRFTRDKRSADEKNKKKQTEEAAAAAAADPPPPVPPRRSRSVAPQPAAAATAVVQVSPATVQTTPAAPLPAKPTLLINGGCALYVTSMNGRPVRVINTCAFDSLASILACAYVDVPAYRAYVNSTNAAGNAMLQYCRALALSGPARGPSAAADRTRVLWPALDVASLLPPRAPGLTAVLDGKCNVAHVVTRLLTNAPSAVEVVAPCRAAGCVGGGHGDGLAPPVPLRRSSRLNNRSQSPPPPPPPPPPSRVLPSATVVLDWPAGGPDLLQAAVDEYADERLAKCASCSRPSVSRRRVLSAHLLIEADSCAETYGSGSLRAALLPVELFRDGNRYVLYGIIHYSDHHYQSVIRKPDYWEVHNDLKNVVSTMTQIGFLVPHLIVYIRT